MTDKEIAAIKQRLYEDELKATMPYFKHDVNAHEDENISAFVYENGIAYYGLYWLMVERLYARRTHYYDLAKPQEKHQLLIDLSYFSVMSEDELDAFISALAQHQLIDSEIYAESKKLIVARVLENIDQKAKAKANQRFGGIKRQSN